MPSVIMSMKTTMVTMINLMMMTRIMVTSMMMTMTRLSTMMVVKHGDDAGYDDDDGDECV